MNLRRIAVVIALSLTGGSGLLVSAPVVPTAEAMVICFMEPAGRFQGFKTLYGCEKLNPFGGKYVNRPPAGYTGNWNGRQHKWVPVVLGGQNCVTLYHRDGNIKVALGLAKSFTPTTGWEYQGYEDCR